MRGTLRALVTGAAVVAALLAASGGVTAAPSPSAGTGGEIRGGDAFLVDTGRCVVGFTVTEGFVATSRCGPVGGEVRTTGGELVGVVRGSTYPVPGGAWVETTDAWTLSPSVGRAGGGTPVLGSTLVPVGGAVCATTSTSGWRCGNVLAHDQSVAFPEGTVSGLTRTTLCSDRDRDEGTPVVSGNQAQGMLLLASGPCPGGGGSDHVLPVNPLLAAWGLTLRTA
ncbi:S1 family peptidase [Actinoalloteichus caeruleus]|uniref:S1 family peptidase n=1 Tax=Actinoalloteichus cyanogriseus TaxID=2893586 RepID=UPI000689C30E|nr:S1 family peptidase [Actinoalloteichus caeruleus]